MTHKNKARAALESVDQLLSGAKPAKGKKKPKELPNPKGGIAKAPKQETKRPKQKKGKKDTPSDAPTGTKRTSVPEIPKGRLKVKLSAAQKKFLERYRAAKLTAAAPKKISPRVWKGYRKAHEGGGKFSESHMWKQKYGITVQEAAQVGAVLNKMGLMGDPSSTTLQEVNKQISGVARTKMKLSATQQDFLERYRFKKALSKLTASERQILRAYGSAPNLKALNRVVQRGLISADEVILAIQEALRMKRMNPRMAEAIGNALREVLGVGEVIDVEKVA